MTVRQLVEKLKKMPQTLQVGVASGDNSDHEISDWPTHVILWDKSEIKCPTYCSKWDVECYDGYPDRCVVIRC